MNETSETKMIRGLAPSSWMARRSDRNRIALPKPKAEKKTYQNVIILLDTGMFVKDYSW